MQVQRQAGQARQQVPPLRAPLPLNTQPHPPPAPHPRRRHPAASPRAARRRRRLRCREQQAKQARLAFKAGRQGGERSATACRACGTGRHRQARQPCGASGQAGIPPPRTSVFSCSMWGWPPAWRLRWRAAFSRSLVCIVSALSCAGWGTHTSWRMLAVGGPHVSAELCRVGKTSPRTNPTCWCVLSSQGGRGFVNKRLGAAEQRLCMMAIWAEGKSADSRAAHRRSARVAAPPLAALPRLTLSRLSIPHSSPWSSFALVLAAEARVEGKEGGRWSRRRSTLLETSAGPA